MVDQYPEPLLEIHPKLALKYGIQDHDLIRVVTRRGEMLIPANVVETIREDTVFIPYHWGGKHSANQLTISTLDPVSKMPEFKVCACKLINTGKKETIEEESKAYQSSID